MSCDWLCAQAWTTVPLSSLDAIDVGAEDNHVASLNVYGESEMSICTESYASTFAGDEDDFSTRVWFNGLHATLSHTDGGVAG